MEQVGYLCLLLLFAAIFFLILRIRGPNLPSRMQKTVDFTLIAEGEREISIHFQIGNVVDI